MEENKNKYLFESMPVVRAVAKMAIPTIMGQLILLIYNVADTFFIGRTGNPLMVAGASLVLPLFNFCLPIAGIAGVGGGALVSRLLGVNNKDEAERASRFSVWFSIMFAALFSLVVFVFMDPVLKLLGAGDDIFDYAKTYATCVVAAGAVPTILGVALSNLVRSVGESMKAGLGIALGGVLNIVLDPLFMFVVFPSGSELLGAGVATLFSNCVSCIYFMVVVHRMRHISVLSLSFPFKMPERANIAKLFAIGIPSAITTMLFDVDYIIIDKLMSVHSSIALAAVGIVLKAERFPLNVGVGICQGMVPIVAYNFSSGNYKRMRQVSRFSLFCGIACAVISIAAYEIFAFDIIRFFIGDAMTIELGTSFLRIRCLATVFMFMSFYHVHLFNSYGHGTYAMFLGVMRWAVLNIPLLFVLDRFWGMYGIVWTQLVADALTVLVSFVVHHLFARRNFCKDSQKTL